MVWRIAAALFVLPLGVMAQIPASCQLTEPPRTAFVPPAPYPSRPTGPTDAFYTGSDKLWTLVRPVWSGGRERVFWWTTEIDSKPRPPLTVSGRQLDGPATFVSTEVSGGIRYDLGHFLSSMVQAPVSGCWEITGRLGFDELKFVVWAMK